MAKSVRLLSVSRITVALNKKNPPVLLVSVEGTAATPGYTNIRLERIEKELSPDRIYDLQLVGDPPTGIVPQIIRPVIADALIDEQFVEQIIAINVHARTNQMTEFLISDPVGPSIMEAQNGWGGSMGFPSPFPTTFSVGEEGPLPSTRMLGEEGSMPTTFAIGEEMRHTVFLPGEGNKPFFGETDPRVDDPFPVWTPMPGTNPFGSR